MQFLKKFLSGLWMGASLFVVGQNSGSGPQPEIYNQFYMNPYLYNPAYSGVEGHSVLYFLYNQRWSIQDAPKILHASFHTPLKGGIGIGVAAYNSSQGGLLNKSTGKVSGSYLVTMDRTHYIRFGMSVGAGSQTLNFGELDDPTDPAFLSIAESSTFLVADFGMTYHFDHFNVGFSIPNLIGYDIFQENSFAPIRVKPLDNLLFQVTYRGHLSDDIAIEPHLLYRYSHYTPSQLEANVIFHVYHVVWLSAGYRQDNNFIFSVGTKVKERFGIGYAFEMGDPKITGDLGPTHEIHIGYHLGSKKAHAEHVSSFIKSHRLTAEERAEKAELDREKELAELQSSRSAPPANDDALTIAGTAAVGAGAVAVAEANQDDDQLSIAQPTSKTEPDPNSWAPDEGTSAVTRINEFGEKERAMVITRTNANGETEKAVAWVPEGENWTLAEDAGKPLERTATDGTKEIGVKYYRTDANGNQELVIKWEPVVSTDQAQVILAGTTLAAVTTTPRDVEQTPEVASTTTNTPVQVATTDATALESATQPSEEIKPEHAVEMGKGDQELTEDFRTHDELGQSDEHLVVVRGNHMLELPEGHYVVAGAFEEYEHAETYSDQLFDKGYHDVIVGFISARGYYYVVTYRSDSLRAINTEKDREKKRAGMSKVWVLHVKAE